MSTEEKVCFQKIDDEVLPKSADSELLYATTTKPIKSSLKGDRGNFILLFFLYVLQGLPVHICLSIPLILQMRGALYSDQVISMPHTYSINNYYLVKNNSRVTNH